MDDHVHSERISNLRDGAANLAEADDAKLQPVQFHQRKIPVAKVGAPHPFAFTHGLRVLTDVMREFEEESERELRH